jgi:uncharacterized RDD family membrane protein YckC
VDTLPYSGPESIDTAITVESPEGIEFTLFPAGPAIRSCAWGIDQIAQWTIIITINVVSEFFGEDGGAWMMLLLIFCVDWFYHTLWEIFCRGQTPGKKLLGIRVLRSDGSPVNPGASFLRNLLRFADTFLFLCPVALLTMMLSRGFRRLGDWTADTLVVYTAQSLSVSALAGKTPGPPDPFSPQGGGEGGGVIGGEERQGILMFTRRYPLLGRARADEIAAPLVESLRREGDYGEDRPREGAADYLLAIGRRLLGD